MTSRKPPGLSWESWIDQAIKEGQESGAFDGLAGAGRPQAGIGEHRDEDWWIKEKLKREELSYLPPTLAIRKELDDVRTAIATASTEQEVRSLIADINGKIRNVNRLGADGPPSSLMPLDEDRVVASWRAGRAPASTSTPEGNTPAEGGSASRSADVPHTASDAVTLSRSGARGAAIRDRVTTLFRRRRR